MSVTTIEESLCYVRSKIKEAFEIYKNKSQIKDVPFPTLVAVTKFQPIEKIKTAYSCNQFHFGENYIKELNSKSTELKDMVGIKWHFIGKIQKNKIKLLISSPNLYCIETVEDIDTAIALNKELQKAGKIVDVLIQINSSREDSKNGCLLNETLDLGKYITDSCQNLNLKGVMTIGSYEESSGDQCTEFNNVHKCCMDLVEKGFIKGDPVISMGMSMDYEKAILNGSTSVRVGSRIFGERKKLDI